MPTFNWRNTGAITGTPLATADLKKQLEIATSDTSHDDHLGALASAAVAYFEKQTRYLLGTRDVEITIDHFASDSLYLPIRPINSLATASVNGTDYLSSFTTDLNNEPPRIYPTSYTWPSTTEPIRNIVITGNAGIAVASIPADITVALKLLADTWFAYREDFVMGSVNALPIGVQHIIDSYKLADGYLLASSDGQGGW
jgi:uncharacterized phiE125 gp8 family phage protein